MPLFKFDSNLVHKIQNQKLLFVSIDPDKNEVFEFEGLSSTILTELMAKDQFSFDTAETLLHEHKAEPKDLIVLWNFCLENQIIIPVS